MKAFRTWPVVALALGGLLLLVVVSVVSTRRKAQDIYAQLDALNTRHREIEAKLRRVRSDVHLSGIYLRDFLLDHEHEGEHRRQLMTLREATVGTLGELRLLVGVREAARVASLRSRLDDYWEAFDPMFGWTPAQKLRQSAGFLRREVLPRREAVLAIAREIEQINNGALEDQRAEVAGRERELREYLNRLLWGTLALGLAVAVAAVIRIRLLERRSEEQHRLTERAESEMRQLSNQLVHAQEEERRRLSRELHDEVGQTLTALRIELGKADRAHALATPSFVESLAECKRLVERLMQTTRDLAMGLRPSMLDDLGLEPALAWLTRDFSRRYKVPVELQVPGDLRGLSDAQRTCIYRVAQEALTNCARHSRASRVWVSVERYGGDLHVTIRDNGIGIADPASEGLGLLGIEERLRELGGALSIESSPGKGAMLRASLPMPADREAALLAHSAR